MTILPSSSKISRLLTGNKKRSSPENLSVSLVDDYFVIVENPKVEQSRLSSSSIENDNGGDDNGGVDDTVEEQNSEVLPVKIDNVDGDSNGVVEERNSEVLTVQNKESDNFEDDNGGVDDAVEEQNSEVLPVKNKESDSIKDDNGDGDRDSDGIVEERYSEELTVQNQETERIMEILRRNVVVLWRQNANGDDCNVYLVGTSHASEDSCREVQAVINLIKPQVVFLELCSSRKPSLFIKDPKVPTYSEMIDMWKKQWSVFGIAYSWCFAKATEKLEVVPGCEFRAAFDEAVKCGSKIVLGDRPIKITMQRMWNTMPLWHKTKLLCSVVFGAASLPTGEALDKLLKETNVDMLTLVIQEKSKQFPTLMETFINERDQYMSAKLFQLASENSSVVAVVGKGHLQGIRRNWKQPVEIDELLAIPSPGLSVVKILSAISVTVVGAAIGCAYFFASKQKS